MAPPTGLLRRGLASGILAGGIMAATDVPTSSLGQTLSGAGRVLALPTLMQPGGLASVDVDELGSAPYTIALVDGYWAPR
jgi:hypothetical protein